MGAGLIVSAGAGGAAQTAWQLGNYSSVAIGAQRVLFATCTAGAGSDKWSTFREQFATAGYVVPAGKTLYVTEIRFLGGSIATTFRLLYGDTDVGQNGATAPTNSVYQAGGTGLTQAPYRAAVPDTMYNLPFFMTIPTGKYPALLTILAAATLQAQVHGHEE